MLGQLFVCRFGERLSIAFRMQSSTVSIENPFTFLPLRICIGDRVTGVIEKWRPKPSLNADVPHAVLRPRSLSPVNLIIGRQESTSYACNPQQPLRVKANDQPKLIDVCTGRTDQRGIRWTGVTPFLHYSRSGRRRSPPGPSRRPRSLE